MEKILGMIRGYEVKVIATVMLTEMHKKFDENLGHLEQGEQLAEGLVRECE